MEADPLVAAKFWTPPFSIFGRGRGEQVRLGNGRWVEAPPPLRSGKHLPGLSKASAFEVRRANTLAKRAFKSLAWKSTACALSASPGTFLDFPEAQELRERQRLLHQCNVSGCTPNC